MPLETVTIHEEDEAGQPTGRTWEVFIEYREETFAYGADADGHRGERRTEIEIDSITSWPTHAPEHILEQAERQFLTKGA